MKNLKKLKLSNADIMNEQQMKMITGGYEDKGRGPCVGKQPGDRCEHPNGTTGTCLWWEAFVGWTIVCWGG